MAEIKETRAIAPVPPAAARERLNREQHKPQQRRPRQQRREGEADDGRRHVDEYA